MITDEQIEKRSEELAEEWHKEPAWAATFQRREAYKAATIERLKDARESLRLLEEARYIHVRDNPDEEDDPSMFMDQIGAHIAHLKKLLGI